MSHSLSALRHFYHYEQT